MKNLINLIVFTSIFAFMGCKKLFNSEMIPAQQYTVSGYLTPFNTDSVWADTNLLIHVYHAEFRKEDNGFHGPLGMGANEEYLITTDSTGYFEFQYNGPEEFADNENNRLYRAVKDIAMWVQDDKEESSLLYTSITPECNMSNFKFVYDRFREVNAPIKQGICD